MGLEAFAAGESGMVDLAGIAETVKAVALAFSLVTLAYAGFVLMTNQNPETRSEWKEIAAGVFIGLSLLFLAPVLSSVFSGSAAYCR